MKNIYLNSAIPASQMLHDLKNVKDSLETDLVNLNRYDPSYLPQLNYIMERLHKLNIAIDIWTVKAQYE